MDRVQILAAFEMLARSQGSYGRVLRELDSMSKADYDAAMDELEAQNFGSVLELVMYMEG